MKYLSLTLPGSGAITNVSSDIPQGGLGTLEQIIAWAINLILVLAILVAFAFVLRGGFLWITSSGDKQKVANARNNIFYAILGLIIMFLAYFIVKLIEYFFQGNITS